MNTHLYKRVRSIALATHKIEQQAVLLLFVAALVLGGLYVYFVASAVVHAVVRKDVQDDIARVHSEIAELEVVYLQHKDAITLGRANSLGFVTIADKVFIERTRYIGRADTDENAF